MNENFVNISWSSCNDTDKTICTSWGKTNFEFLSGTTCVNECPSTTFGNETTNECDACDTDSAHWLNCSGNAFTCTSCNTTSSYPYLQNGFWMSSCTTGTYIQNETTFDCNFM